MDCRARSQSAAELGVQFSASSTRRRPGEGEPERGRDAGRGVPAAPSPRALGAARRSAARGRGAGRWLLRQLCAPHRCQAPRPRPAPAPLSLSTRPGSAPRAPVSVRAPPVSPLPCPRAPAPSPYHSFLLSGRRLPRLDGVTPMAICSTVRYFWYFILSPLRSRAGPRRRRRRRRHSPSKRCIDQLWAIRRPAARTGSRSGRRAWPARAAVRGPVPPPCAPSARSPPPRASSAPLRTGGRGLEAALSEPCNAQVRTPRASVSPGAGSSFSVDYGRKESQSMKKKIVYDYHFVVSKCFIFCPDVIDDFIFLHAALHICYIYMGVQFSRTW